ncbi:MAG: dihydrodipicolinate synthase family protein [Chloroflexi bacterium]|nr:dihydrodipicolinate synthase family protein [Chloroflexota bacterium]
MSRIAGVFNILATPFSPDGSIDIPSLRNLVSFQIDKGAHGFTILGVMGEAAKLTVEERQLVVETVIDTINGQVPVVVGTSHNDVHTCIDLSNNALAVGATGVMIALPFFATPVHDDDQIMAFYEEVAASYSGPIVVQDYPPVNNAYMSPQFLARIADNIPNARHLKLEDPPLLEKISAILSVTDKYLIFGGLGGMFFLEELRRKAAGTMTGFAFTEILVAIYDAMQHDNLDEATRIFDYYLPLIRFENQPLISLTIRKELLHRRGAIAYAALRQPFAPIDEKTHEEITWMLQRVGIGDAAQRVDV